LVESIGEIAHRCDTEGVVVSQRSPTSASTTTGILGSGTVVTRAGKAEKEQGKGEEAFHAAPTGGHGVVPCWL
jgi:hypothetical protein